MKGNKMREVRLASEVAKSIKNNKQIADRDPEYLNEKMVKNSEKN